MSDGHEQEPSLILDVRGLREWAHLSENEAGVISGLYQSGALVVATQTWNEFCDAYPDLQSKLNIPVRIRVTQAHRLAAATLAENAPLPPLPLSVKAGDYCVAGIAKDCEYTIITCASLKRKLYHKLSIPALTLAEVLAD